MTITKKDFKLVRFPEHGEFKIMALKNITSADHIHWKYGGEFADGNKINNASEEYVALLQLDEIIGKYFMSRQSLGSKHVVEADHIAFLRQDKAKLIGEVTTNLIYDFRHIRVVSSIPHDFNNKNLNHDDYNKVYLSHYNVGDLIVFPDKGATIRFEKIMEDFSKKKYVLDKVRDANTGAVSLKLKKQDDAWLIKEKNCVIFDDIISYGGTFSAAAKILKESGATKVKLVVNHADRNEKGMPVFDAKKLKADGIDEIVILEDSFGKEWLENE